jgi:BirA family transcriptional regulator, biotin operon repressor / biotin---[acetyl-CoA-carboxylase] ligase
VVAAALSARRARSSVTLREQLIRLLADGEFHSGARLAARLGVSRTAVWKVLHGISELGLEVHSVPKRGYRLSQAIETLSQTRIESRLSRDSLSRVRKLEVLAEIESTNSRLFAVSDLPTGRADVCIAEFQSAGRGRRGRSWTAPYGGGLCLSLSWQFPESPRQIGALSLATGVGVLRALSEQGVGGIGLKWPNDILCGGRKLGGILIELRAETAGPAYVVLGIGLNFRLSKQARRAIQASGVAAVDLAEIGALATTSRNMLAAAIVNRLLEVLAEFQQQGFRTFMNEWRDADALAGEPIRVLLGEQTQQGIARGIDEDGALMLETPTGLLRFVSGEISVRAGA